MLRDLPSRLATTYLARQRPSDDDVARADRHFQEWKAEADDALPPDESLRLFDVIDQLREEYVTGHTSWAGVELDWGLKYRWKIPRKTDDASHLTDILTTWVRASNEVRMKDRRVLADAAAHSRVRDQPLERVSLRKRLVVGDTVDWTGDVAAFSRLSWSRGMFVNQINANSSHYLLRVKHPKRGLEIDYDLVPHAVGRSEENEVLLTGRYEVVAVESIPGFNLNPYDTTDPKKIRVVDLAEL